MRSYGAARVAIADRPEGSGQAEQESAEKVDQLRAEFDAAVDAHCMRFGFDRVEDES